MQRPPLTSSNNTPGTQRFKRDRPTIGVLVGWSTLEGITPDHYRVSIIRGIQSAARSRGCHLLLSWGIRPLTDINRLFMAWPVVSSETDFIPVGPWNTDGLIVFTPLSNESQSRYVQELIDDGFPVMFIASGESGPQISVNNHMGIHQAVAHLAQHGHRRIAFLAGLPTDKGDSKTRLESYQSALTAYNLAVDPDLVVWGWHNFSQGYQAVQGLLERGVKFTAVMASNDNSAIGAMHAIREAGLKVPRDIAIIGFDDQPSAVAQVPPLTSVHVPLHLIGEQTLLLMADHLTRQTPLESVYIPTKLIQRQSCGCQPETLSSATLGMPPERTAFANQAAKPAIQAIQQQIVSEMLSALPSELRYPAGEQIRQICSILVESFYVSLKQENRNFFETAIIESTQKMEMADASIDYWQEMISFLRRGMVRLPVMWRHSKTRQLAEDMLHQARAIIGESAQRIDQRHEYQRAVKVIALNLVTARLSAALTDQQVVGLLNNILPSIGIRHARLMHFESDGKDPVAWSVVPSLDDESLEIRFRSRDFPPPELYGRGELLNVLLLPLIFQNEVLGYAAFDASDLEACAVVARQLASTIKVSRLHSEVSELSRKAVHKDKNG